MLDLLIRNARVEDRSVDVGCADGHVVSVEPAGSTAEAAASEDIEGRLLVAAAAEPHAHLDKVLTADSVPNPAGDLFGAITAWRAAHPDRSHAETVERAERVVRRFVRGGITAIRTHVDCGPGIELDSVEALLEVKERWSDLVDIQVCALVAPPTVGADRTDALDRVRRALRLGVDLVGGVPYAETDRRGATANLLEVAADAKVGVDFHTDETLDPDVLALVDLAELSADFPHPVAASHCCSLAMQDPGRQREVAAMVAEAGIGVVTLPQTNLFLQSRAVATAPPRGLTAIGPLRAAGASVCAGADNVQDPFNTVGRADPCETASLLVTAGHVDATDAWAMVSTTARSVMGLAPAGPFVGAVADLVALPGDGLRGAVADGAPDRVVIRGGRVVARTTIEVSGDPRLAVQ